MNLTIVLVLGWLGMIIVPHVILKYILWLPTVIQLTIHIPLVVIYWWWQPTQWLAFRAWPVWSVIRDDYLHVTYHGPGAHVLNTPRDDSKKVEEPRENDTTVATTRSYCFAVHPHGVYAISVIMGFALHPYRHDIKVFGSSLLLRIPVVKECVGWGGTIPATPEKVLFHMQQGHDVVLAPGGIAEVPGLVPAWQHDTLQYPPETEYYRDWCINNVVRGRGFLKYAQAATTDTHQVYVVPVWSPHEELLYDVWLPWPKFQRWLLRTRLRYAWPIFTRGYSWLWFFWPKPIALPIWIGEPIMVQDMSLRQAEDAFYTALGKLKQLAVAQTR